MQRLAGIVALLVVSAASAHARSIETDSPRTVGYFIGDRIERNIAIVGDPGEELIQTALPQIGPQTYWLDLVDIESKATSAAQGAQRVNIRLVYQIFYSALEPRAVELPRIPLYFKKHTQNAPAQGEDAQAYVPALSVIVSPLREIQLNDVASDNADKSPVSVLKPDRQATFIPAVQWRRGLASSLALLLASGAGLLWYYAIWPFQQRKGRPFAGALRELQTLAKADAAPANRYETQMIALHRAFDTFHEQRLFSADLPQFFAHHRVFDASKPDIQNFFESSRLAFFANDKERAMRAFPEAEMLALAQRLAREERRVE